MSNRIFLSIPKTTFKCPDCKSKHTEESYSKELSKSKDYYIYKTCIGCKKKIGITADYKGNVSVWMKRNEVVDNKVYKIIKK